MPLRSGPGSFDPNIRTLMGEVGKSPHVQSREQALAIAFAKERGRAEGGAVDRLPDRSANIEDRRAEEPLSIAQWIAANNPYLPKQYNLYRHPPQAVQRPTQEAQVRAEGGIVNHDRDKDLPAASDDARLIPVGGGDQYPPGYLDTMKLLWHNQEMLRRGRRPYFRGGFVGWR